MNLLYLAELHLKDQNKEFREVTEKDRINLIEEIEKDSNTEDYTLLDILDTALYIRRRIDKIEYDKSRYERRK